MSSAARNSIWAALGALCANLALLQLAADRRLLIGLLAIASCSAAAGLGIRWRGRHVLTASLISLAMWLVGGFAAIAWAGRNYTGGFWERTRALSLSAIDHMEGQTAPMAPHDGVLIFLLLIGVLVAWLTDIFFVGGRFVVASLLVMITPMLVVVFVPHASIPAWSFVAMLVSWAILALAATRQRSFEWGNLVPADQQTEDTPPSKSRSVEGRARTARKGQRFGFASGSMISAAAWLLTPALALALIVGLSVPPNATPRVDFSELQRGPIELSDPTIRLHQSLRRAENLPLLRYRTNQAGGVYLRTTALVDVQSGGWALSDMKLQRGYPEQVPGLSYAIPAVKTEIELDDFDTIYLPAPYAPLRWEVEGRWSFDPLTLTVLSTARASERHTAGLKYVVESTTGGPNFDQLSNARAGVPADAEQTMAVPDDVPVEIKQLATQLAGGVATDGQKALALQNFLRDETRFSYSLNAPAGTGFSLMLNFLFQERSGYCIHYASAMALLARTLGIASRVAIGFTPGTQLEDGSYQVRSYDMHAWPELYFEDLGWVRFEPTVSVASAPAYTSPEQQSLPEPTPIQPQPLPEPTLTPTAAPSTPSIADDDPSQEQQAQRNSTIWAWLVGLLILAALAATPSLLRQSARSRRSKSSGPQAVRGAWTEVASTAIDLGMTWPAASPRAVAAALTKDVDKQTAQALRRLALAQEQALYADVSQPDSSAWREVAAQAQQDAAQVTASWWQEAPSRRWLAARLWPASLWSAQIRQLDAAGKP